MSGDSKLALRLCNDPQPEVSTLAVVWSAGDPAAADHPTVIARWLRGWDDALDGALGRAQQEAGFAWTLQSHLWLETRGRLPFAKLLLFGATPRTEDEWPGWDGIGERLGRLVAPGRRDSLGLVVDRIFATGLGELATGLRLGLGDEGRALKELSPSCLRGIHCLERRLSVQPYADTPHANDDSAKWKGAVVLLSQLRPKLPRDLLHKAG